LEAATRNGYAFDAKEAVDNGSVDARAIDVSTTRNGRRSQGSKQEPAPAADPFVDRKSISEVLHDIYDKNVQ
jgi:hypothetical protein